MSAENIGIIINISKKLNTHINKSELWILYEDSIGTLFINP